MIAISSPRAGEAREIPPQETQALQARLSAVASPDAATLARSLGIETATKAPAPEQPQNYLQDLGDLDGDGITEYALEWTAEVSSGPDSSEEVSPAWSLYLLKWDRTHWQTLPLMGGFDPFSLQVLPAIKTGERLIAVTIFAGGTRIPFPAVFRLQNHSAALVWDGQGDESRYEGYDHGQVQFQAAGGALQMLSTGRADPGLLVFPKAGERGFEARALYNWTGDAFVPVKTDYTANRDYALYRFIAALHLHDFRTAYGLIDPPKFLKAAQPDLAAFRKMMEDNYPEFLDDRIFSVNETGADDNSFNLHLADKVYVYEPFFSEGPRLLLTGLARQERKPEAE